MRKRQKPPSPAQPTAIPQLLDINEVARALSIGRTKVYELIKRDGLQSVKLGHAARVSLASLKKWIEQRE